MICSLNAKFIIFMNPSTFHKIIECKDRRKRKESMATVPGIRPGCISLCVHCVSIGEKDKCLCNLYHLQLHLTIAVIKPMMANWPGQVYASPFRTNVHKTNTYYKKEAAKKATKNHSSTRQQCITIDTYEITHRVPTQSVHSQTVVCHFSFWEHKNNDNFQIHEEMK